VEAVAVEGAAVLVQLPAVVEAAGAAALVQPPERAGAEEPAENRRMKKRPVQK
jgi:hypothetical protein